MRWLTPAALCAAAFAAAAQSPPSTARKADPLDARASVPAVAYEPAFSRYRRAADDKAVPWRDANDTAARIGGWRTYAREAHPQTRSAGYAPRAQRPQDAMKTLALNSSLWRPPMFRPRLRLLVLLTGAAVLSGCAAFSPDGGFAPVEQAAKDRLGKEVRWSRSEADQDGIDKRVGELLARPLSADDAVQVALLNNRGLQASFQELGITESEVVQAGRLPNPGFSFSRLRRGDEIELERGIHFNLARLIAMPMISAMEARRFEATKGMVTMSMLAVAADTRKAWVTAAAARPGTELLRGRRTEPGPRRAGPARLARASDAVARPVGCADPVQVAGSPSGPAAGPDRSTGHRTRRAGAAAGRAGRQVGG